MMRTTQTTAWTSGIVALVLFTASSSDAGTFGQPVIFGGDDIVISEPSSSPLHLSMNIYVEVPDGPIDVAVFAMLFNITPSADQLDLVDALQPSDGRPPLLPPDDSFVLFVDGDELAVSGYDGASAGLYTVAGEDVTVAAGTYGLFSLEMELAANTVGTFDIVFDTTPEYNGMVSSDGTIYPNIAPTPAPLASVTVIPEPAACTMLLFGAAMIFGRRRR